MTRILAIGDLHVYPHNEFSKPVEDGYTTLLQGTWKSVEWVASQVRELKPDLVVQLGDYFHQYGAVDTVSLQAGVRMFKCLKEASDAVQAELRVLVGNHDQFHERLSIHALEFMGEHAVASPYLCLGKDEVLYVPYLPPGHPGIAEAFAKSHQVAFVHLDIVGAAWHRGLFADEGVDPQAFKRLTVCGHYHLPQRLTPEVLVVGSLEARSFHDQESPDLPRGILLLERKGREAFKVTRIPNPHTPFFKKLHLEDLAQLQALTKTKDKSGVDLRTHLRVYGPSALLTQSKELAALERRFRTCDFIPLGSKQAEVSPEAVSLELSPEENLERYLGEHEVEVSELKAPDASKPKEDLLHLGMEILKAARQQESERAAARHRVQFLSAKISNYGALGEVELPLQGQGLILIEGRNEVDPGATSNGSSKSTLFDAILWCLTGRSMKAVKAGQVVREKDLKERPVPEGALVQVELLVGDDYYSIRRTRDHHLHGSYLALYRGEEDLSARLGEGTQGLLDRLLGGSYEDLRQVAFMAQGLAFRFSGLGDGDRKQLLEQLAGLGLLQAAKEEASRRGNQALIAVEKDRMTLSMLEGRVSRAREELLVLRPKLEESERALAAWQEVQLGKVRELEDSIRSARTAMEQEAVQIHQQRQLVDAALQKLNICDTEYLQHTKAREALAAEEAARQHRIRDLESLTQGRRCSLCGSEVVKPDPSKTQELQELRNQVAAGQLRELDLWIKQVLERKSGLFTQTTNLQGEIRQAEYRKSLSETQILSLSEQVAWVKTEISPSKEAYLKIGVQIRNSQEEEDNCLMEAQFLRAQLAHAEYRLSLHRFWLGERGLKGGFSPSGLSSLLLQRVVGWLNERLEEYSRVLLGSKRKILLTSSISLKSGESRAKIGIEVQGGRAAAKLSSGETRRLDLAIQFALNDLASCSGLACNLLVCDEIDAGLDPLGLQALVELLQEKARTRSVFLVTHDPQLKQLIPTSWTVLKEGDPPGVARLLR